MNITDATSFCFLPWINLETFQEGILRLCCYTNSWNDCNSPADRYEPVAHRLERLFNSDFFRGVRLKMLKGEYPRSCARCYEEEKKGVRSPRQYLPEIVKFTYTFEDAARDTKTDGSIDPAVRAATLRLGNACNLACRICQPYNSSRWEREFRLMDKEFILNLADGENAAWNFTDFRKDVFAGRAFRENLLACGGSLAQIHFAGGEPLIMSAHWEFLDYLLQAGKPGNIALSYSTNGAEIPEKAFAVWNRFKSVTLYLSIDDIGQRVEYQRYGLCWDKVVANIDRLRERRIPYLLMPTISMLNAYYLDEFIRYFRDSVIRYNYLTVPSYLSAGILPERIKRDIVERCEPLLSTADRDAMRMRLLDGPGDVGRLRTGLRFNAWLDKHRGQSFKDTFPEYHEKIMDYVTLHGS